MLKNFVYAESAILRAIGFAMLINLVVGPICTVALEGEARWLRKLGLSQKLSKIVCLIFSPLYCTIDEVLRAKNQYYYSMKLLAVKGRLRQLLASNLVRSFSSIPKCVQFELRSTLP